MKKVIAIVLALGMMIGLMACGETQPENPKSDIPGLEDGVLTVAMECAYEPYNWAQPKNTNGSVPIKDSMLYANGYDVMMAKKIADTLGVTLEIVQLDWDSLVPAVQSGIVDAVIAGQSMTAEREKDVDFAGPYLYASIVCLTKKDSSYANATSLADLAGATCTSQSGTIWYETCLPQIEGANILSPSESAPAMLMALASGTCDLVCTDMPTAQAALIAYPEFKLLDFSGSNGDFNVSDEDINIGISIKKGNTALKNAINDFLKDWNAEKFNALMNEAIKIQPLSEE